MKEIIRSLEVIASAKMRCLFEGVKCGQIFSERGMRGVTTSARLR